MNLKSLQHPADRAWRLVRRACTGLLTVRFVDPEGFNRVFQDTPLEVVLVNAKTNERAVEAQAIAQASLAGGGEAEKAAPPARCRHRR